VKGNEGKEIAILKSGTCPVIREKYFIPRRTPLQMQRERPPHPNLSPKGGGEKYEGAGLPEMSGTRKLAATGLKESGSPTF